MEEGDQHAGYDKASLEQAALRAEGARLRAANGNTLTYGAYSTFHKHGLRAGVHVHTTVLILPALLNIHRSPMLSACRAIWEFTTVNS
jgi:hypothetical protein